MERSKAIDRDGQVVGTVPQVDLHDVAEAMRSLSIDVAPDEPDSPLQRLVSVAVERVPGTRWASVSHLRGGRFTTPASTDEAATRADELQYEVGSGPCVDAALDDSVYVTGDAAADSRWPAWGQRVAAEVGVRSVFAQRLHLLDGSELIASLNIYSDQPAAFDDHAVGMGLVLATHAASILSETIARDRATNLSAPWRATGRSESPWASSCTSTGSPETRPSTCCALPARTPTASSPTSPWTSQTPGC